MAAIELGVPYYIYNPAKTQHFALNAPADANFVGYVTDVSGLDDSGIRENAQVVVAGDGGHHGPFWQDRRPWTMTGIILPVFPLLARDQSQELIQGVFGQASRLDGYLTWTPADGIARQLIFRKQQPVRISRGQSNVEKVFQLAGVCADYRVTSWVQQSITATGVSPLTLSSITNSGNADAAPKFVVTGPVTGTIAPILIGNNTTGKQIKMTNAVSLAAGATLTIDLTGPYPLVFDSAGNNWLGNVDVLNTDWSIAVAPGANQFYLSGGASSASGLAIYWNHSWL